MIGFMPAICCFLYVSFLFLCYSFISFLCVKHIFQCVLIPLIFFFFFFWLRWVFVAARGLSLVAASRGCSSLWCAGFSLQRLLLLQSMGCRCAGFSSCSTQARYLWPTSSIVVAHRLQSTGSVVVVYGLSCSAACGFFLDQGLNPCPLHWQADS